MIKILLDTHVLLWAFSDSKKLDRYAREQIATGDNRIFVSLASLWELQIKETLGKIQLPKNFFRKIEMPNLKFCPLLLPISNT